MAHFGADKIFEAAGEVEEKDIEEMIEEGRKNAEELKKKAEENMKDKVDLADFEVKPLDMYEFENENFLEKRRKMQKEAIQKNA